jgi:molecular chaperone GrpE
MGPANGQSTDPAMSGDDVNQGEKPVDQAQVHPQAEQAQAAQQTPEPEADLVHELALAQAKAAEFQDLYVRARAELENVRRRSQEDVSKAHKFAVESFAEGLVPVKDSLEMALAGADPTLESLREGVNATLNQLKSAFDKNKLMEINPVGEKFDPNRHQAISMVPGTSVEPAVAANHVVSVLQKGYLIHDRVLRPALVTVAQG